MKIKFSWTSTASLILLALLLIFFGKIRYTQWKSQKAIEQEKRQLEQQVSAMQQKNQELSDSLSYLNSSDFKERVARQQLDLKRNGEIVFGFTDAPTSAPDNLVAAGGNSQPNYEKWLNYFFGKD